MADNVNRSNIDDILNGVRETLDSGEISANDVRIEFVAEDSGEISLVFDDENDPSEIAEEPLADPAPIAEEQKLPAESEGISAPETEGESDNSLIWTTYVPRFTEVSDTYRMRGQTTPTSPRVEREEREIAEAAEPAESTIDPTSEENVERAVEDATVVTSGTAGSVQGEDVSTVFKFDPPEEQSVPSSAPRETEEDIIPEEDAAEEPSPAAEAEEPEVTATQQADAEQTSDVESRAPYVFPDPVSAVEINEVELAPARPVAPVAETVDEEPKGRRKRREYTSFSERDGFIDRFVDSITSVRVRLIAAFVLFLALTFVENISLFGIDLISVFGFEGVSGAAALIGAPFVVALFLLALPEVVYSFASLVRGRVVPELNITVAFTVSVFYYAVMLSGSDEAEYPLVGAVFGILAVLAILGSLIKKKAELISFEVASSVSEKRVVDRKLTRNLPDEHRALDGKIEAFKSRIARVFRTNFVSDFFSRSDINAENTVNNLIILLLSLGISLVSGAVAFFILDGISSAAVTVATVFMISSPALTLLTHKLPYLQAMRELEAEHSTVVGEGSMFDYATIDAVTFDDTEIFDKEDVNLQRIMVYGKKENLPKALAQMSALFTVVGGPLAHIFANAVDRHVSPADKVTVELNGVSGEIDGVEVLAGTREFMESRGLKIPHDPQGDASVLKTTRIMYAAEGGDVYAKFYVRYMLSEEFTMLLPSLTDEGMHPLVYTRDPNINNELFYSLTAGTDTIRVLKKQNLPSDEVRLYQRLSLGMVTGGNKLNVINSLFVAKKYASLESSLAIVELMAMIVGAVISLILTVASLSGLPSFVPVIWHLAWVIAMSIIGKKRFKLQKEKNNEQA